MANTVGQNAVSIFTSPINGTAPIDADQVRGNDNIIRFAYNLHDADPGIHLQSSTLAQRPAAGTNGRKWVTADAGSYKLWFDDGTRWHEVGNDHIEVEALADENLVKGDVVSVTGYNVGLNIVRVAKYDGTSPAFGVANETIGVGTRGYVINTGLITGIDTTGYGTVAEPAILFPSDTTNFTATKPVSGEYQVVAFLLRNNSTNGVLYVEFSAPRIVERSDNTVNTLVLRDGSGDFSAGTITASLTGNVTGNVTGDVTGNASTATALQNVRTLWGQNFDGTANVTGNIDVGGNITNATNITASGTITATTFVGTISAAATAVKLSSARTFALTGDVTGTTSSDLDTGFSISTTVASIPAGLITNTEISATAAIAYSKLALSGSIVDADINASAAIAYSKLALSNSIVNADISSTAAIAYSKLSLTGSIVDADINASAAIVDTKLATISTAGKVSNSATTATASNTADTIVLRDSNGDFSAGTITADVAYDNTVSGLTATDVQDAIDEVAATAAAAASVDYYTVTVETTDWVVNTDVNFLLFFTAEVSVPGLFSTDRPLVTLDLSSVDLFDLEDVAVDFQAVYRVEASDDDELTLYATTIPTVDFDLLIQVVR
jgi:hypothetical protein